MFSQRYRLLSVPCALALLLALPASACYSGLGLIPTADVVGAGNYSIELQTDGNIPAPKADTYLLNTEIGIGNRFEAGLDYDFSEGADPRAFLNAKYVLAATADTTRALAIGACNIAADVKAAPYVTAFNDFGVLRVHAGAIRGDEKARWFVGADRDLTDRLNLGADYISGDENASSVALSYQLTERVGLFGGVIFPNAGGDALFTLHLILGGSYRKS